MTARVDRCAEWRSLASSELDGELAELDAARLQRHLARCAECSAWLAEMRTLTAMLRDAQLEAPRRGFDVDAVRRGVGRAAVVAATVASVAAAALAVIGLDMRTGLSGPPTAAGGSQAATSLSAPVFKRGAVVLPLVRAEESAPRHGRVVA